MVSQINHFSLDRLCIDRSMQKSSVMWRFKQEDLMNGMHH